MLLIAVLTRHLREIVEEPPIWLRVLSAAASDNSSVHGKRRLEHTHISKSLPPPLTPPDENIFEVLENESPSSASLGLQSNRPRNKRQKGNGPWGFFARPCLQNEACSDVEPQAMPDAFRNLSHMHGLCSLLRQSVSDYPDQGKCLGYLETSKKYKHFLYPRAKPWTGSDACVPFRSTLLELLSEANDRNMTIIQQLKIASQLAIAALQFRSTPWMRPEWELQDVGLIGSSDAWDEASLDNLHLNAVIQKQATLKHGRSRLTPSLDDNIASRECHRKGAGPGSECSCAHPAQACKSCVYGVDNVELCSLGIALLQIGHRKPLNALRSDKDHNNLHTARRLARGASPLGPKFEKIVRKCLRCDFNAGTDLGTTELQSAVFTDVVCELENMISSISI